MFKLAVPSRRQVGYLAYADPRAHWRAEHGLEFHGEEFYYESHHRRSHLKNERAIRMLREGVPALIELTTHLGDVMMVAHEHEDDIY